MKNEERILEILAEYLKKTDQTLERIDKFQKASDKKWQIQDKKWRTQEKRWEAQEKKWEANQKRLDKQDQKIEALIRNLDLTHDVLIRHLHDAEREAKKRDAQQSVLLKEILSISKRVQNLEDKK